MDNQYKDLLDKWAGVSARVSQNGLDAARTLWEMGVGTENVSSQYESTKFDAVVIDETGGADCVAV